MLGLEAWGRVLNRWLAVVTAVGVGLGGAAVSLAAETANFEGRELSPGFSAEDGSVNGYTGGSYSLAAVENRDRDNNPCLGYGDSRPDHIVVLKADFAALTFQLDSGGKDTTLMLKGPGGVICGDDIDTVNLDDRVSGKDFKAGTYSVWVGTIKPGDRQNYRLTITEAEP